MNLDHMHSPVIRALGGAQPLVTKLIIVITKIGCRDTPDGTVANVPQCHVVHALVVCTSGLSMTFVSIAISMSLILTLRARRMRRGTPFFFKVSMLVS